MVEPIVVQPQGVFVALVGSTALSAGDPVYDSSGVWELADASDATKFAEAIATDDFVSGEIGTFCTSCIVIDGDAPYSQGDNFFLSETAGNVPTTTRPTTNAALVQVVGFGLSGSMLRMSINPVREEAHYVHPNAGTDVGVIFQLDNTGTGNYGGLTTNAQNELIFATFQIPENSVALEIAYVWLAAEASAGTPTFDLFVSSSIDGAQWDAVTQDSTIAASADEGAAPDEMQRTNITTAFNATDIWRPGALLGMRFLKKDAGTDITFKFGVTLVCQVV